MILTGVVGVSAANTLTSNGVLYSNAGSSVTTVEGALNELYANYNSLLAKGNASASEILSGKTALVGGKEVTGTMTNIDRSIVEKQYLWTGTQLNEHNTWLVSWIPSAYYSGWQTSNGKMYAETYIRQSDLTSSIGLTSDKLLKGQTVAGVSGTATSDATANASQILSGKTAYVNGNKVTGTMPNRSCVAGGASGVVGLNKTNYIGVAVSPFDGALHWTENTDGVTRLSLQVPHGVYGGAGNPSGLCGDGYVGIETTVFGNASANQVLSGAKFTSQNGLSVTGSMANKSGATVSATTVTESGTNALISIPSNGYYDTNSKISVPIETIKNEVSSLGGTYKIGSTTGSYQELGFVPDLVCIWGYVNGIPSLRIYSRLHNTNIGVYGYNGDSGQPGLSISGTGFTAYGGYTYFAAKVTN